MKKLLIIFLFVLLIFSSSSFAVLSKAYSAEKFERQAMLLQEYSTLIQNSKNDSYFDQEFAGAYFDESGNIVLNVVNGKTENFKKNNVISNEFVIKEVEYSLKEINDDLKVVEHLMEESIVKSVARSEEDNTIIVTLFSVNDVSKELVESLTYLDNIIFKKVSNGISTRLTTNHATPGTSAAIFISTETYYVTVGFAARDSNGDDGFVTTGHGGISSGNDVRCDNVFFMCGDVRQIQFENYSHSDAAFVELRDSWYNNWLPSYNFMTGTDYYTNVISSTTTLSATIVQNMTITAFGSTSGKQSGTVLNTYYSDQVEDIWLYGFVKCDYIAILGDSGATVTAFVYNPSYGYPTRQVLGLQSYSGLVNGEWDEDLSYSVFSKADEIFEDLELSPY